MSTLVRNIKQVLNRTKFVQRSWYSAAVPATLPSNVEEIGIKDKMGFSADRHRDMSYGVVQSQPTSMFGSSFLGDQMSSSSSYNEQLESYNSLASLSLNAVTQNNVPQPFSPSLDKTNTPRLNMPETSQNQHIKFTASDLQETLHPHSADSGIVSSSPVKLAGNMTAVAWLLPPIINNNTIAVRYYTTNNPPPPPTSESAAVKLKRAVKDYGATVIVFHVTISIASLSICYAAVASGLDVPALLIKLGVASEMLNSRLASGASTFLVSYALHKLFAPVRMFITLTSVPFIVRFLRLKGILKNPPKKKTPVA